jgi:hypothetical protein
MNENTSITDNDNTPVHIRIVNNSEPSHELPDIVRVRNRDNEYDKLLYKYLTFIIIHAIHIISGFFGLIYTNTEAPRLQHDDRLKYDVYGYMMLWMVTLYTSLIVFVFWCLVIIIYIKKGYIHKQAIFWLSIAMYLSCTITEIIIIITWVRFWNVINDTQTWSLLGNDYSNIRNVIYAFQFYTTGILIFVILLLAGTFALKLFRGNKNQIVPLSN